MAAYFIAQYTVNNSDLYADYSAGAGPTLAQYGAELVAFDVGESYFILLCYTYIVQAYGK